MTQIKSLQTGIKFKNTPIGKIPVDWGVTKLENICDVIGGSTPTTTKKEYWQGDILWATPTDITSLKGRTIDDTKQHISKKGLASCAANILPAGSVLMTSRATIGACAINTQPMATNQGFASLVCKETVHNWFIYYMILLFKKKLERLGSGSTFKEVSKKSVKSLYIPLPPFSEQKRIADILSMVDDAIEETDKIIEKTKELKRSFMQKLLTRGIGHKKFKKTEIGEIPEEWEVCTFEEIAAKEKNAIKSGPFGSELKKSIFVKSGYKVYGQEQIIPDDFSVGNYYISQDTFNRLKDFEIKPSDILMSLVGTFGKISVVPDDVEKGIIDPRLIKITLDRGKAFPLFIKFLLTSLQIQKHMINFTHGLTMGILNTKTVKTLLLPIPTIDEQMRIADILLGIEAAMKDELTYYNNLQTLKKSLMQVLLTGRVRVKLHY